MRGGNRRTGAIAGVFSFVLDALARALQLNDAERAYLFQLAHAADGSSAAMRPRRRPSRRWTPRPSLQWVLDRFTAPAIVRNGRMDLLAVNHLGRAIHAALYDAAAQDPTAGQPHFARFTFLDLDAAHDFYPDWDGAADTCVAILRTEAGRDPHDKDLHDLVGELSTRSQDFRRRWSAHMVRYHGAGTKHFHHSDVGDLELAYESLDMISDPGLTLTLYACRTRLTHSTRPRPARCLDHRHRGRQAGPPTYLRCVRAFARPPGGSPCRARSSSRDYPPRHP